MGDQSAIQWTDATWNPVTGCSKVSPGCAHCYAEGVANRFWATQYPRVPISTPGDLDKTATFDRPREFTDVQCHEDRLDQPLRWKKPRKIFVNSMSDLFHEDVPDAFIDRVFAVMALAPQHTFQVLTKRAERMLAYFAAGEDNLPGRWAAQLDFEVPLDEQARDERRDGIDPDTIEVSRWERAHGEIENCDWPLKNVWLGVSVENQRFADERIPLLLQTPAAVRFISAEPLLGPVDLAHLQLGAHRTGWGHRRIEHDALTGWESHYADGAELPRESVSGKGRLDWVIVGGESGGGARPFDVAWARSIVQQCQAAGVLVFVKQLGANACTDPVQINACGIPLGETPAMAGRRMLLCDSHGGDMAEWPEDLRVREMPEARA